MYSPKQFLEMLTLEVKIPNFKKDPFIKSLINLSLINSFEPCLTLSVMGKEIVFQLCLIKRFFVNGFVFFAMFFSFSRYLSYNKLSKFSTHKLG